MESILKGRCRGDDLHCRAGSIQRGGGDHPSQVLHGMCTLLRQTPLFIFEDPGYNLVLQATPSDPTTIVIVGCFPPNVCGLRTEQPRVHSAASCSQNNQLHCNILDPERGCGPRD